ncbi:uncharacterized protein BCR38DRAFT_408982 [Pseudomassariella vexata]|uniref:Uncharacterized protein n=1 Tax=Pseudomassariella vexata TaxID=1141098 RepID=A0A1Y2E319_9PEZI|nr:uncharacterized protein BCR38DRAFT_408982 [Pseudomassariella vexata]ORY65265.1 hypothetical protein BCR38DRAFT_408982 [Pseudomassariella vexata]
MVHELIVGIAQGGDAIRKSQSKWFHAGLDPPLRFLFLRRASGALVSADGASKSWDDRGSFLGGARIVERYLPRWSMVCYHTNVFGPKQFTEPKCLIECRAKTQCQISVGAPVLTCFTTLLRIRCECELHYEPPHETKSQGPTHKNERKDMYIAFWIGNWACYQWDTNTNN